MTISVSVHNSLFCVTGRRWKEGGEIERERERLVPAVFTLQKQRERERDGWRGGERNMGPFRVAGQSHVCDRKIENAVSFKVRLHYICYYVKC